MPPGCCGPSPTREVHFHVSALPVSLSANKVEEIMWYIYVKEGCLRLCIKTHRINFTTSFKVALWSWRRKLQAMPAGRADLQHHPPQGGKHADVTRRWIMCTSLYFPLEVGYKWKSRDGCPCGTLSHLCMSCGHCGVRCWKILPPPASITQGCGQGTWLLTFGLMGSLACAACQICFSCLFLMFQL